jgi:dipeptidyl aminopeptidase/acylaminoacyl peptidase
MGLWARLTLCLALAAACSSTFALLAQSKRPMTLVDLLNVPRVIDPRMTADGRRIVFTLLTTDWPNNTRVGQIWQIRPDGSGLKPMTSMESGVGGVKAWSPDGTSLAFLARGADASQIFVIPAEGGTSRQVSHHATDVSDLAWAPDGASLYFLAGDPQTEAERESTRLHDVYAYDEDFKQQHLWKINIADGKEQRLTSGNDSIISLSVASSGNLVVVRAPSPTVPDAYQREVWSMRADGSAAVQLTHNKVEEGDAALSPDGSQLLFVARANDRQEPYYNANLFLMPATGGAPHALVPAFPYEVLSASWAADGQSIWAVVNMGLHSEIFHFDLATRTPHQVTNGAHTTAQWSLAGSRQVFLIDEPARFGDIWTLDAGAIVSRRVSSIYDYLDREFLLPRQERVQWKGADGVAIDGILVYPLDYRPGTRYPLVVQMHGGPEDSDKFSFGPILWQTYQQVFAAHGYAVLKPNYRGSAGYGNAFYRDVIGGFFKNNYLDVLAGVDRVIAMGVADPDKLVVMGYSAGGHLTNKLITFTNRFKAAAASAGVSDWISMYGQTDTRSDRDLWFGGTPWQKDAPVTTYWDNSPLKDVWKVRTPTLFFTGERDPRVPLPQAIEMMRALRANGVPTHLEVAPATGHVWVRPRHQLQKMNLELEWFDRYALKRTYAPEAAPSANDSSVFTP